MTSSKAYQLHGSKLKSPYHHNSIDETSLGDFSSDIETDTDSHLNYNFVLNNGKQYHQSLANQKQIARKLMNVRQSQRFSPSSSVLSATVNNNQVNFTNQPNQNERYT